MASIGCDVRKDPIFPDIAFKLPRPRAPGGRELNEKRLTVGLGVMSYAGWYNFAEAGATIYSNYVEKITRFILWLLDRGDRVRILTGETSDRRAVEDILKAVLTARPNVPAQRIVAEASASLHELMRQIADTDVVVATRFHNVVCALKLGRPTLSLGYAKKNDVLLEEMGLGAFCQHVERLDVDLLIDQFSRLVAHRKHYEQHIRATTLAYSQRLSRQDRFLIANFL
jgi:polysaccharide pyruvyl transferase WcaK-like protein